MKEHPLVAFTLLAQAAVGAFLTVCALDLWAATLVRAQGGHAVADGVLLAVGPVMGCALFASLLHLGSPSSAWRSLANLRSSWLSREILLALVFTAAASLCAALRASGGGGTVLGTVLAAVAGISGLALVYAMVGVYRLRTMPAWDTPRTAVAFFTTAVLLGTLGVATALALGPGVPYDLAAPPLRALCLGAAAGFTAGLTAPGRGGWHAARRALLLAGLALTAAFLLSGCREGALLLAACAPALAAEGLGRYLFYVEGPRRAL